MTDNMREEFEAWINKQGYFWIANKDAYWEAWKASRAAMRVELPKQWFDDGLECDLMVANRVLDALDAAGLPYE